MNLILQLKSPQRSSVIRKYLGKLFIYDLISLKCALIICGACNKITSWFLDEKTWVCELVRFIDEINI